MSPPARVPPEPFVRPEIVHCSSGQRSPASRTVERVMHNLPSLRLPERPTVLRAALVGAVIVATTVLLIELTNRYVVHLPNPPIIYLLTVVYTAFRLGLPGGLAGGAVSLLYATQFFAQPGVPFQYTSDNLGRLVVLFAVTPVMAVMVGRLRAQSDRQVAAMRELSEVDPLTGIANRRAFVRDGERDLPRAHRLGISMAVVAVDIDHFKQVNDTYGHAIGDVVLRTFAERLRQAIRDIDVLARIGGEEFALILPGTDAQAAVMATERIRAHLNEAPITTARGKLRVTASFGVALAHTTEDLAAVLVRADEALYQAKSRGRDRVVLAAPTTSVGAEPVRTAAARRPSVAPAPVAIGR